MKIRSYAEVMKRVQRTTGIVPKSCYIADVKAALGLIKHPRHRGKRLHPCPTHLRLAIAREL